MTQNPGLPRNPASRASGKLPATQDSAKSSRAPCMNDLSHLLKNNRAWAEGVRQREPGFFDNLAHLQTPEYLWIGCSDSRDGAGTLDAKRARWCRLGCVISLDYQDVGRIDRAGDDIDQHLAGAGAARIRDIDATDRFFRRANRAELC